MLHYGFPAGLFAAVLEDRFGSRPVLVLSTAIAGIGVLMIPMATSLIHIAVAVTFLVGKDFSFSLP